jgi:hypothetical protein
VDSGAHSFSEAAARLIRLGERETVEALCALSGVQQSFLQEAEGLKRRTTMPPPPAPPHPPPAAQPRLRFPWGMPLSRLAMLLCGLAGAAFALGFWVGTRGF